MNNEKISKVKFKKLAASLEPARLGWSTHGRCIGEDVSTFVYSSEEPSKKGRKKLQKLCEGCPVLITCRKEAVRQMEVGWWGGMTESERMVWATEELFKDVAQYQVLGMTLNYLVENNGTDIPQGLKQH